MGKIFAALHGPQGRLARSLGFSLLVLAGLGYALLRSVDVGRLVELCASARPGLLLAMVLLHLCSNGLRALRLHVILHGKPGLVHTIHVYNVGILVNCLLPLRAGELCMALLLGPRLAGGRSNALSRLFVDRLLDVLTVMALFLGTIWAVGGGRSAAVAPGRALALGVLSLVLVVALMFLVCACEHFLLRLARFLVGRVLRRDPRPWEARVLAGVDGMRTLFRGRILARAGGLSLLCWFAVVLTYQAGMSALFPSPGLESAVLAVCLTVLGLLVAPMPAGVGTTHGAIVLALGLFGIAPEQALAFAVLFHGLTTLVSILIGIVSVQRLGLRLGGVLRLARNPAQTPETR